VRTLARQYGKTDRRWPMHAADSGLAQHIDPSDTTATHPSIERLTTEEGTREDQ